MIIEMTDNIEATPSRFSAAPARRDLFVSVALLGLIVAMALGRIALDGNWQKVLRISLAFLIYSTALMLLVRLAAKAAVERFGMPFCLFAVAAGAAELASGWLRPDWRVSDTLFMPLAAALLIGGFHWLALRTWRPLRQLISANHTARKPSPGDS